MYNNVKGIFSVNESENQFEFTVEDATAFLEYYREENKIFLTYTEAPVVLQGTGVASQLVKQSLQYAKDNNLIVVPLCTYVFNYINKHPEWYAILPDGYQM
ncbi:GNAT family N-acetyltransferase [Flavobacterium litorale]|uniref:N-acetyltransferase n=1 Tax=Flavobacterium litorale TaxID=2856519 RepID=A0ABX8V953_9FLAO|nr:GNAT family N-acetyltransferase [Flavobacterium litorale]QYJ69379.1 N-acetyltransferase [Flavobacterium litorale]